MRYISQDDPVLSNDQGQPLGSNLYVYCLNNPVMKIDPTGKSITAILIVGALIGAAIGGCIGYAAGASAGNGAVLWSGKAQGMDKIAMTFAKKMD